MHQPTSSLGALSGSGAMMAEDPPHYGTATPTVSALRKIVYGIRTQGPMYLLRAIPNEIANPRLPITRRLRAALITMHDRSAGSSTLTRPAPSQSLQFVFDLAASPVTFDFTSYLAAA